jgi:hypothetical protein
MLEAAAVGSDVRCNVDGRSKNLWMLLAAAPWFNAAGCLFPSNPRRCEYCFLRDCNSKCGDSGGVILVRCCLSGAVVHNNLFDWCKIIVYIFCKYLRYKIITKRPIIMRALKVKSTWLHSG